LGVKIEPLRLGFYVLSGKIPRGVSTWNSSLRNSSSTWARHVEFCHLDIESLRLGLLKVKPSLRDSSFKGLLTVTSAWSCVAQAVCGHFIGLCSCVGKSERNMTLCWQLCGHVRKKYDLVLATFTSIRPCEPIQRIYSNSTSNKNLSQTL